MICSNCGNYNREEAAFCNQCGASIRKPASNSRRIFKWAGIGCGGLIGLFIVIVIIGAIASSGNDGNSVTVPMPTYIPLPTPTFASSGNGGNVATVAMPTYIPLATPTPIPVSTAMQATSPATDREALVAFYYATGGPKWRNDWNWLTDKPLEDWKGVTTDSNGRVTELDLSHNNLTGHIVPWELGSLINLTALALSHNNLTGPVPWELGHLTNLVYLDINNNKLMGRIPQSLTMLTKLDELQFYRNEGLCVPLHRMPQDWTKGVGLVSGPTCPTPPPRPTPTPVPTLTPTPIPTAATSVATDRKALVALLAIFPSTHPASLSRNWLSDRPLENWNGVTTDSNGRVTELDLSRFNLTGSIPPELGNLSNLSYLDLSHNSLRGPIPPELSNLLNLTYVDISDNGLTGPIPPDLGQLFDLTYLNLSCNITFGQNGLTGPMPPELGNLSNLTHLDLGDNYLTGPIPPELGNLSNLTYMDLGHHECFPFAGSDRVLTGPIPPELGNLSNLKILDLDRNELTGPIPPELSNLSNLTRLNLQRNQLSGELPQELTRLTNLQVFLFQSWPTEEEPCVPRSMEEWLQGIRTHHPRAIHHCRAQ